MIVLGINAFHADSSAAITRDGALVAAAEEERFRRSKHWAGFPSKSIAYCLREAGVSLGDLDHVAVNQDNRANLVEKVRYAAGNVRNVGLVLERLKNRLERQKIPELLDWEFKGQIFKGKFHNVEHHLAHLSSAFYVSPFNEAVVVSVDGFGDFASAAWGIGNEKEIRIEDRVLFPHSLGVFYQALTQYLGFPHYGDEYKVMGLAPYGVPSALPLIRKLINLETDGTFSLNLKYFVHHRQASAYQWAGGEPQFKELFSPALEDLLGPRRQPSDILTDYHRDLARSVQTMYEEAFFHLLHKVQERSDLRNLALAGGCAMNSVANGKIRRMTDFKHLYVQAAAGDAGGAIGAAYTVWHKLGGSRSFVMNHAYWGPNFQTEEISRLVTERQAEITEACCRVDEIHDEVELCRTVAAAIADGKVVGWFQGRMEWGPRALGNRSILCDPRRGDMKAILNAKIKRRESFRPFAPSVLEEAVPDWFEEDVPVPFMTEVIQIRENKRELVPAVTHVDGSGRLQTVNRNANALYYRLIEEFYKLTGIPMILNTSFNENEPVVCEPSEALNCFLRTEMDVIVLGDKIVSR